MYKKLVIVTRKTRLQELIERFNTRSQAKFYIEHAGGEFEDYEREDNAYHSSLEMLRRSLEFEMPQQLIDRSLVPTFQFQKEDLVVTLGQDGLVANTAKYVMAQPIVAVNPEPARFDGILLPFLPNQARSAVGKVIEAKAKIREVTLAEIKLHDGQRLLAFNDLFIGARSHVSAQYLIRCGKQQRFIRPVECWSRLVRGRPAGCRPSLIWRRVWPAFVVRRRSNRFGCHGKIVV